jgi:hypothetical protein
MLGRRERHCRWARCGDWPVNIAKPWAVVCASFATGVLRQSAGPFHFASRAWQVGNLVEFGKRTAGAHAMSHAKQSEVPLVLLSMQSSSAPPSMSSPARCERLAGWR